MKSKKGSSAVFLSIILAALISIVLMLIYGVREETERSRVDGIVNMAGDSLISEFDYHVQKEYGLFMLKGSDGELKRKLRKYVTYSTDEMGEMDIQNLKASGSRFSILNTELVEEQILEYVKMTEMKLPSNIVKDKGGEEKGNNMKERSLKHGPTIASLPSADVPRRNLTSMAESLVEKAKDFDMVFKEGSDDYIINIYILNHFNNRNKVVSETHFFKNEAEYILGGELTDRKNEKRVEMAFKAMRFLLNLSFIKMDPEKQSKLITASEILTPGPAAAATKIALETTWAYAEADNDVELLCKGYEVPIMKDDSTWAIDLEGAIEGITGKTVVPDMQKGYDYKQYMQVLLFFQDRETKISRILDLIQINMRNSYNKDFLIAEHSVGIEIYAKINGRVYGYEKKY